MKSVSQDKAENFSADISKTGKLTQNQSRWSCKVQFRVPLRLNNGQNYLIRWAFFSVLLLLLAHLPDTKTKQKKTVFLSVNAATTSNKYSINRRVVNSHKIPKV